MKKITVLLYSLILTVLLTSCTPSKLSRANFERIQTGMTIQEVVNILGEPTSSSTLGIGDIVATSVNWENRNTFISVQFFNSKVKIKKMVEGVSTPREQ